MWRVDLSTTPEQRRACVSASLAPISGFGNQWLDIWGLESAPRWRCGRRLFWEPYAQPAVSWLSLSDPGAPWRPLWSKRTVWAGEWVCMSWGMPLWRWYCRRSHRVNTHSRTYDRGHTLEHAFSPVPGAMERTRELGLKVTLQHALVYSLAGNMQSLLGPAASS